MDNRHLSLKLIPCTKSNELPINWCFDEDKQPHYLGQEGSTGETLVNGTVEVKDFTHFGFQQCLADKTIVFVGDSRVRYQVSSFSF